MVAIGFRTSTRQLASYNGPPRKRPIIDGRRDDMKDMARRMERGFGLTIRFIGRICVAAFLAGLSSTPAVQNKELNNFLISIAMFACLPLWQQKHRMTE